MLIFYSILAVLLIGQLICTLYLITKYTSSPEKKWKNKVLSSLDSIQSAQKREQQNIDTMSRSQRIEVERLESQAINRLLQQMPVSMLADYPGIGPSTVEKLQYAGFSTVFDVHTRGINIHGIGDKRLSDINIAQNQLCQQVLAKIKNADSMEYQQLAQATRAINEAYSEKTLISEARLHAIGKVHELMQDAVAAARKINFWGYLKGVNRSHFPDRLRNFGFPNLAATLEKAEAKARSKREAAEKPEPSKPILEQPSKSASSAATLPKPAPMPASKPVIQKPAIEQRPSPQPTPLQFLDTTPKPKQPVLDPFTELLQSPVPVSSFHKQVIEPLPFQTVDLAQELMEIAVELGYLIARADGRLAQAEQQMIEGYLDSRYRTDVAMHTKAMSLSAHYTKAAIGIQPLVERMRKHCQSEAILHLMNFAKEVALAGNLNDKKHHCYLDLGKRLGLALTPLQTPSPRAVEPLPLPKTPALTVPSVVPSSPERKPPPIDPAQLHRKSLEIEPDITLNADLIRRQFNKLSERLQSTKLTHLGEEFEKLAEERYASVKEAAEFLLLQLGEQLVIEEKPTEPIGIRENKELEELFGV